jgi:hypothetical protein
MSTATDRRALARFDRYAERCKEYEALPALSERELMAWTRLQERMAAIRHGAPSPVLLAALKRRGWK